MEAQAQFLNRVRSLFNIDGDLLPELTREEQVQFVTDPARYLMRASDDHAAAIWREIEKRQPKPATPPSLPTMLPVVSSNVLSIGHDGKDLIVAFRSGGTYRYEGVPAATFTEMRDAKSVGGLFFEKIKGKFTAVKVAGGAAGPEAQS